ncbi:MAG: hypothetical protein IJW28_03300 [Clostridia bacterium]|nr:hypothetical protein [Clostridia bacterium]
MKLKEINYKIKCDMSGCKNLSKYAIQKGGMFVYDLNICSECIQALYKSIGEVLVPKSPVNMMNVVGKKRGNKNV